MKKLTAIIAILLALPLTLLANDWKSYMSYHNATMNLPIGNKVYTLARGSLFSYTNGATTVKTYSKSTGLSSTNITHMAYCEDLHKLVLVYSDYNIDILGTNDSIINIPQYKNSGFTDKTINDLTISGNEAFLSTNFGLVVINLKKAEYTNAYEIGMKVRSAAADEDRYYVLGPKGIYTGERKKNLLEASNWVQRSTSWPAKFITFNGGIYALYTNGLYSMDTETFAVKRLVSIDYSYYSSYGHDIVIGNKNEIVVFDENEESKKYSIPNDFAYLTSDGTRLWASRKLNGLQAYTIEGDTLKEAGTPVIPDSPIRNYFSEMNYTPEGKLLIAGGALAYNGITSYEGTIMAYKDGKWTNFSEDSIKIKTTIAFTNVTAVAEDPNDANHHFATSADGGLYEFRNAKFVKNYNCDNSPIKSLLPKSPSYLKYNRLTGAKFDSKSNLWMFNDGADTTVLVLTPDQKWKYFYFESLKNYPTFDKFIFDDRGWVWMTHRRWAGTYYPGIACLNYNGTIDNKVDDKFTFCSTFTNQNGTTTTISLLYDAVFDRKGQMWIGTDQGVFILQDPSKIFSGNVTFHQPIIPRNDGTNYADYLLEGVAVKAICVDGANRKWIGTTDNGLYLVSEDGLEIIHHFTCEDSPLLSNSILSLAIDPESGLVMIGTDKGLVSYRSDATEPSSTLKESNIKVFPNPVRPEYEGLIRVTGFTHDADVKIATTSGIVIAQGKSLGGTFTWDGRDGSGNRVATGIYHVIGSDADGKKGIVAKILIVK